MQRHIAPFVLGILCLAAQPVEAVDFFVGSTAENDSAPSCDPDTNICENLRSAIDAANFTPGLDTIIVPVGDYLLTEPNGSEGASGVNILGGDLDITDDVVIEVQGFAANPSARAVIDASQIESGGDRVFHITEAANNVTFRGLTIQGGLSLLGAGIRTDGNLTLEQCEVTQNLIRVENSPLEIADGAGIHASSNSTVILAAGTQVFGNRIEEFPVPPSAWRPPDGGFAQATWRPFDGESTFRRVQRFDDTFPSLRLRRGAGIYSAGRLTLRGAIVRDNTIEIQPISVTSRVGAGAGIYVDGGAFLSEQEAEIRDNTIVTSEADLAGFGGGIVFSGEVLQTFPTPSFRSSDGTLISGNRAAVAGGIATGPSGANVTVTDSTISDNEVTSFAGGLLHVGGAILIEGSEIARNRVTDPGLESPLAAGGGILFVYSGTVATPLWTIRRSAILSNNVGFGRGGGIGTAGQGRLLVENSTLSGNTAGGGSAIDHASSGDATLDHVTVVGHQLPSGGGSLLRLFTTMIIRNSILEANAGTTCVGTMSDSLFVSQGANVTDANVGCGFSPNLFDVIDPDGGFVDLDPAGTFPDAHFPLPGSLAIDFVPECVAVDQLGNPRPAGPACDSGAIEIQSFCGDGIVQTGEQCDPKAANSGCCTGACTFEASTTQCRDAAGVCDVSESCTGTSAACPGNSFASPTTECRAPAGTCDVAELCTGESTTCPNNLVLASGTLCRASGGLCDVPEVCSGESALCPGNSLVASGVSCRAAAGVCDVAEVCSGESAVCPANQFAGAATQCRASAGLCDTAETCSGTSAACPADALAAAGELCRFAANDCDVAEVCTGTAVGCPADSLASAGTSCSDGDVCTQADVCNGVGACSGLPFPPIECGVGICNHVVEACTNGVFQICDPFEGAQSEVCVNGVDESCNGEVDEDCQAAALPNDPDSWGEDVEVWDGFAYVAGQRAGLQVVQLDDGGSMLLPGAAFDPPLCPDGLTTFRVEDVAIDRPRELLFAAVGLCGMAIFDISDRDAPDLLTFVNTDGWTDDIAISGIFAFLADFNGGVVVVGTANPLSPVTHTKVGFANANFGTAVDVEILDDFAYVATSGGLRILDIQNPPTAQEFSRFNPPAPAGSGQDLDIEVTSDDRILAFMSFGTGGLRIIDVTNPSQATQIAQIDSMMQSPPGAVAGLVDVEVAGRRAFLVDAQRELRVFDVGDPANPEELGGEALEFGEYPWDVHVADGVAYIAWGDMTPGNIGGIEIRHVSFFGVDPAATVIPIPEAHSFGQAAGAAVALGLWMHLVGARRRRWSRP